MITSSTGRQFIEQYEGLFLEAYDDANDHIVPSGGTVRGTLTIGYGHTSSAGSPKVYVGQRITKDEADAILSSDLHSVEADVNRLVKVKINQNQFDALVSFHYNTGALGKSSVLRFLNQGNYKRAADAILLYNKANGKQSAGLVKRRLAEKKMFLRPSVTMPILPTAIVATGGLMSYNRPEHMWYIIGGVVFLLVAGTLIYSYLKGKFK